MSDIFIVSINEDGDAGFNGPFASEAAAKYAAEFMHRPRLCRVEWLGEELTQEQLEGENK